MFAHTFDYPSTDFPLIERGHTQETEPPWRKGSSLVLRLPFTRKAVAVGRWLTAGSEDDFHSAVGIHEVRVPTQEIRTW